MNVQLKIKEGQDTFDIQILQQFEKIIGENGIKELQTHNISYILGTWNQVATSRSTETLGSGPNLQKVQAVYTKNMQNITVENSFVTSQGVRQSIKGISRDRGSPYCRTVEFPSIPGGREGNYWIIYISPNEESFIVSAPIIVNGNVVDPNFGLYILTKLSFADFWKDKKEIASINQVLIKYGFTKYLNEPIITKY
jgi:hypothetical protein